ncbi:hypothetical protein L596_030160 [Steinernema carpocapsae]|uniref:C-type lectin domain-containing protein n=1 Tax=Steinernema carpocapsae TaxID=34508 RepID=A0A4U5LRY4_STECR|nr:hypothetical protein L596_030160 [Steinernema carpocapsae]
MLTYRLPALPSLPVLSALPKHLAPLPLLLLRLPSRPVTPPGISSRKPESATAATASQPAFRENGHLASIHSKVENDFVGRLVGSGSFYDDPWIGASSPGKNNIFVWTDGTPWDYTNWYINEPNQIGWENCVEIYLNDGDNYRWNNVPCETPRFHVYVCKKSSN